MRNNLYIGIDLGGTFIKTVLLNQAYEIIREESFPTDDSVSGSWKQTIINHVNAIVSSHPAATIKLGLAAPGLADEKNEMIKYMPGRMQGLENLHWTKMIGLSCYVLNDAHAACIAEWQKGIAQGKQHVLMLTLGTGVGGAVILNGKLFQGVGGRAGHFGHITVNAFGPTSSTNMVGSLEAAIGNQSVAERTSSHFQSTHELVNAYNAGDTKAIRWWLESVNKLACGLSSLVNAFAPEMIVLGGGIADADDALFKPLKEFMALYEWRPGNHITPIYKAQLGSYSGAIGAAVFAASHE